MSPGIAAQKRSGQSSEQPALPALICQCEAKRGARPFAAGMSDRDIIHKQVENGPGVLNDIDLADRVNAVG